MKSTLSVSYAARGLLLFGGLCVMGVSMAMAQIGAEAQPKARVRAPAAAPAEPPAATTPPAAEARRPAAEAAERTTREPRGDARERGDNRGEARGERRGLGIRFSQADANGLTIEGVDQDGFAAQAGLRAGDRIVSVDGRPLRNGRMFGAYLGGQGGRRVPVIIEREGRQMSVQLAAPMASGDGAWLGVFLQQGEDNARGAAITHVYPAGPAARAGIRSGDVVIAVDGKEIAGPAELIETIDAMKPGTKAEITVLRGDREVKLATNLSNRDSFVFQGRREFEGDENLEPGQGERWATEHQHDEFFDIPEYAMEVEAHRRLAEQHERIENLIQELRKEVQALREEIKARR